MNKYNDLDKIKELIYTLNNASKAYYQENREIISNLEYDNLYDELTALEQKTGIILSNSPTQNVGHKVLGSLPKVSHESKMLSLDKTKEIDRLASFLGDNKGILSYKMDGLTVVLTYKNCTLHSAITRGNGEIGEDITHNAMFFKNIPLRLSPEINGELIIRGEAVISYKDFDIINEDLAPEDKYKNPRNLASGTVRQLNSQTLAKRNVDFIAFSLVKAEDKSFGDDKIDELNWLDEIGFKTVARKVVDKHNINEAVHEFELQIPNNEYATDGLVLTYQSIKYSNSLGTTSKFPKDSIAFKWADELAEATLLDVEWHTSRTGLINPVAIFTPVELEGTTVNRASMHNQSITENLKLGIGDKITIYKANMIIPQIAENLTKSNTLEIPTTCSVCHEKAEIIIQRDGKALKCVNPMCMAQKIYSLKHFVSRDAMNIEGLSEATLEKLTQMGFINNYTDIYSLQDYKEDIINMKGFGEVSYQKLITAIDNSKNINIENFIYALGIYNVGLSNSKLLCKKYNNDINKIKNATIEELIGIDKFGDVIAQSIYNYFNNEYNISLLDKACSFITFNTNLQTETPILEGKIFVITGDVHHYANRKELKSHIERLGANVTGSISSKTSYLINNDPHSSSSKNKKAKELNIPIISEDEFIAMISE